jgi:hypothetical protein
MTLSETFPGGSGQETDAGRLCKGGENVTGNQSLLCSQWPSTRYGTIGAPGLLRSHTSTSSPSRTN